MDRFFEFEAAVFAEIDASGDFEFDGEADRGTWFVCFFGFEAVDVWLRNEGELVVFDEFVDGCGDEFCFGFGAHGFGEFALDEFDRSAAASEARHFDFFMEFFEEFGFLGFEVGSGDRDADFVGALAFVFDRVGRGIHEADFNAISTCFN